MNLMTDLHAIGLILLALVVGLVVGFVIRKKIIESRVDSIESYSKKVLAEAQKEAKTIKKEAALQAKDTLYQMKVEFEKETKEKKEQLRVKRNVSFTRKKAWTGKWRSLTSVKPA